MKAWLDDTWERLKTAVRGVPVLDHLVRAIVADVKNHSKDMAASIAYFGMLSLFPLILGLVALAGNVLKSAALQARVMEWVNEFFPVGADFVTQNIESLVRLRGTAGLASAIMLLWSASRMVGAISRGVNRALDLRRDHALILSKFRNFGMMVVISLLMFASTALTPLADLLSDLELGVLGTTTQTLIEIAGGRLTSVLLTAAMVAVTYRLLPYHKLDWHDILPGLVTATALIELGKLAFVYYVDNVSKFDALYGSISTFIVLMLWLYFFGRSLLFGANVIRVRRDSRCESNETPEKE